MPDLLDKIDAIESSENQISQMQQKIDRLNELIVKQKKMISEQEALINQQQQKLSGMVDIPDDVYELRELIGTQRALLNERETQLEHAKASLIQAQRELELTKNQMIPTQKKLEETFAELGNLKAEIAEKNSELLVKNEKINSLENKIIELQAFSDKLQDEQVKTLSDMESKHTSVYRAKIDAYMKQIEELRMEKIDAISQIKEEYAERIQKIKDDHLQEKADLKSEITKLETILLDSKLISTEKASEAKDLSSKFREIAQKQEELIKKVDELNETKRILEADINRLNQVINGLSSWKELNKDKITFFDKLTILMEQEPLFKTFLIVNEVGAMTIDDLRNATSVPMVQVKKFVEKLQDIDLLEINDVGKIVVKRDDESF
ncbi:MAG: hypothetical protein ACTSR8_12020 [Promethearchaeota archaeon]